MTHPGKSNLNQLPYIIPLVDKTSYLGIIVSYRIWENDMVLCRVQTAQICFRILRKWLMDRHHPLHLQFRLYHQCVLAIVLHGIFEIGFTMKGAQYMISMINQHHRIMTRSPAHLTRENTAAFFTRLQIDPPWITLQKYYTSQVVEIKSEVLRVWGVIQALAFFVIIPVGIIERISAGFCLFRISALVGQTYEPAHFPYIPVMRKDLDDMEVARSTDSQPTVVALPQDVDDESMEIAILVPEVYLWIISYDFFHPTRS